ncbi:lipid kinase, YegS/Rv2252/BmrU family [Pedobacter steynii]|uniref:Lipid kinase, YegS/Rv2252/BmrU family n=1 Tax=Pedobacter steynii TaxID=430522 RepID=A0A1G9W064_9SPHI|nr:diacylglycerol kinase family protein [Pedobacter steynii]NQX40142.1 diacylglycerol kinase family lipid kinase [Pedobacter steynii]SDM77561.1 lipid kinase, YegS/Rv2252/BmrU family [Pedobacter steynii]
MSKSNILFIINPISGGKDKLKIPGLIDANLDRSKFNANYSFTEYIGHASEIAEEAASKNFDIIVAVGGDGTINEIGTKVMQQNKILGILPFGSGNGLSRFLKIPMNTTQAIKVINDCKVRVIDTAKFNDKCFFNMAGMGFDAHISSVFAGNKSRGLSGYLKLGFKEMLDYKPQTYHIYIDGKEYIRKAFVVSVANSSQYGNNAHIAPNASITDGLLDVCIIKEFPMYKIPVLAYHMLNGSADQSNMVEIIQGREIRIQRMSNDAIHIDGEPFFMGKEINVSIVPLSLNIITPDYES